MRKLVISCYSLIACACSCGYPSGAWAQIYGGTTESGTILLSSQPESGAQEVIVAAEPLAEIPGSAVLGAPTAAVPPYYAGFIQEAGALYRLPPSLIHAVISVESNYNPKALSRKGAQGLMQIMPGTARRFGAQNMFDARQNILTGSRYLRWLLDYFEQDIELSVAAYNAGERAVMQAGRRIPAIAETRRYVPKVLELYRRFEPQS